MEILVLIYLVLTVGSIIASDFIENPYIIKKINRILIISLFTTAFFVMLQYRGKTEPQVTSVNEVTDSTAVFKK